MNQPNAPTHDPPPRGRGWSDRAREPQAISIDPARGHRVHQARLAQLAREASRTTAQHIAGYERQRRHAILVAITLDLSASLTDQAGGNLRVAGPSSTGRDGRAAPELCRCRCRLRADGVAKLWQSVWTVTGLPSSLQPPERFGTPTAARSRRAVGSRPAPEIADAPAVLPASRRAHDEQLRRRHDVAVAAALALFNPDGAV
jgi:hypothetical protein